jgi:hypothetical protein
LATLLESDEDFSAKYEHVEMVPFIEKVLLKHRKKLHVAAVLNQVLKFGRENRGIFQKVVSEILKERLVVKVDGGIFIYFPRRVLTLQIATESIVKTSFSQAKEVEGLISTNRIAFSEIPKEIVELFEFRESLRQDIKLFMKKVLQNRGQSEIQFEADDFDSQVDDDLLLRLIFTRIPMKEDLSENELLIVLARSQDSFIRFCSSVLFYWMHGNAKVPKFISSFKDNMFNPSFFSKVPVFVSPNNAIFCTGLFEMMKNRSIVREIYLPKRARLETKLLPKERMPLLKAKSNKGRQVVVLRRTVTAQLPEYPDIEFPDSENDLPRGINRNFDESDPIGDRPTIEYRELVVQDHHIENVDDFLKETSSDLYHELGKNHKTVKTSTSSMIYSKIIEANVSSENPAVDSDYSDELPAGLFRRIELEREFKDSDNRSDDILLSLVSPYYPSQSIADESETSISHAAENPSLPSERKLDSFKEIIENSVMLSNFTNNLVPFEIEDFEGKTAEEIFLLVQALVPIDEVPARILSREIRKLIEANKN